MPVHKSYAQLMVIIALGAIFFAISAAAIANYYFSVGEKQNINILLIFSFAALSLLAISALISSYIKVQGYAAALEKKSLQLEKAGLSLIQQEKLASLGSLIAGITHEIKNPLNFIHNFAELAAGVAAEIKAIDSKYENSFTSDERAQQQESFKNLDSNLKVISKQSERAINTVQQMLLYARETTDSLMPQDLHHLLEEYLSLFHQGVRSKDPNFNLKIEKYFGIAHQRVRVHAEDISRVFLNLLNNAYYTLAEKKNFLGSEFAPTIEVRTSSADNFFEIHIKDNGSGIAAESSRELFKPFFTTKPPGQGTGLGLYISRKIIEEQHEGTLTFQSKEGDYTEFVIKLPTERL